MGRRKPTVISSGSGAVRFEGTAQGVVVGDGANVSMTFNGDAEPEIVVHRGRRVDVPAANDDDDKSLLAKLLGL